MADRAHSLGNNEVIAFLPPLARALSCSVTALFLSQAIYWQRIAGKGRFWYKLRCAKRDKEGNLLPPNDRTDQSWQWETGLTRSQQERARKILRKLDLLIEKKMGTPQHTYYCVNLSAIQELLSTSLSEGCISPANGLDSTSQKERKNRKDGRIQPHIAENSKINSESNRKGKSASNAPSLSSQLSAEFGTRHTKIRPQYINGIQCWLDEDFNHANKLVEQYGSDLVNQAVSTLNSKELPPLPSRAEKQLRVMAKATQAATEAKERARMVAADERAADEQQQHIKKVKNAIHALSQEDRSALINRYVSSAEGIEHSKSYDRSTRNFKDRYEHLLFNNWLRYEISLQVRNSSNDNPDLNDGGL